MPLLPLATRPDGLRRPSRSLRLSGSIRGALAALVLLPALASAQSTFLINGVPFVSAACASEGGTCQIAKGGRIAFGAPGRYAVKSFAAGRVVCSNKNFGDPAPGKAKKCYASTATQQGSNASNPPSTNANSNRPAPTPTPTPTPSPTPTAPPSSTSSGFAAPTAKEVQAARLLNQATWGPTLAEIRAAGTKTPAAWIDDQLRKPLTLPSHYTYVMNGGPRGTSTYINAAMESFWSQAISGQDQLRQRMVLALSEIFVVSTVNSAVETQAHAHASYLDMLSRNAFGTYRQLLEDVARHPTMGRYLSHMGNEKEDPATGRLPDENFAREVMQLFSIGLWELNPDGTRKLDAEGQPIPTYGQPEVMGMAKVFTGWSWGNGDWSAGFIRPEPARFPYLQAWNLQMQNYPRYTSTSEKRIVGGVVIPAGTGGPQSLKIALDTLANHPNVGPFIGRQLIQRFVTSNPSPDYVARVSQTWANNGQGVRGDLGAVVKAILTDPEARSDVNLANNQYGKLREPMVRYGHWLRAFNARSADGVWKIWNLQNSITSIGQNPLRAPSVFNWFRPDYAPPGAIASAGLVAPEFQITHEITLTGYTNFAWVISNHGEYGITPDYAAYAALADRPAVLLDALSLTLTANQLTPATRQAIQGVIEGISTTPSAGRTNRVKAAVFLVMTSPEYTVQR